MKTGRNSPCTCGSGLKYKQCCEQKEGKTSPMLVIVALAIGAVIVAGAMYVTNDSNQQQPASGAPVAPVNAGSSPQPAGAPQPAGVPGSPQPPGPVPAGKVWNVEHGHWHDAPGATPAQPGAAQPGAQPAAQPAFTPGPQPPGPVPAGKVWSTEHGHWHDAPK
jgi:SEC-C motif-containing protein